jgi:hypothetical protein
MFINSVIVTIGVTACTCISSASYGEVASNTETFLLPPFITQPVHHNTISTTYVV